MKSGTVEVKRNDDAATQKELKAVPYRSPSGVSTVPSSNSERIESLQLVEVGWSGNPAATQKELKEELLR